MAVVTICSSAFCGLGRAQAKALGCPDLPITVIPHPFGIRTRDEVRELAAECVDEVMNSACLYSPSAPVPSHSLPSAAGAGLIEVPEDIAAFNRCFMDRHWSDGLPLVPPTRSRVDQMLRHTKRQPQDFVGHVPPHGLASVEAIAINAVLAGCAPEHLPVLIAAVEAIAAPEFNLRGIQATTHPVAVLLIVNGPLAHRLGLNSGANCLGPGVLANATIGRALRLIQQNIGGAVPGDTDCATHGQPGKYTFCCAENEEENPWEPLQVERGFLRDVSAVTVVGAAGTVNMNTHAKDARQLLQVIADTMTFPGSIDYVWGGEPWLLLAPEHAHILKREGLSKADVKRCLWEQSKMLASRFAAKDFARVQNARRDELGNLGPDSMLPISTCPQHIQILVAGGPGTHSVYVPAFGGISRSITREISNETNS